MPILVSRKIAVFLCASGRTSGRRSGFAWAEIGPPERKSLCIKNQNAFIYYFEHNLSSRAPIEVIFTALFSSQQGATKLGSNKIIWVYGPHESLMGHVTAIATMCIPGTSNIVDWAEKLCGQSINDITAGMNNLFSGDYHLALTRAVKALMEGKPNPEIESYLLLHPRAPKSSSAFSSSHLKGPFKEAIVFMIGGGNYVVYGSLQELANRQQPAKHTNFRGQNLEDSVWSNLPPMKRCK
ncbi:hypothetical protein RND71_035651 [Anisodus tanguticus]|uniref:Uncharacterized protein n=1 Tax=Anisodus tanguticus TaxID=243964 RepID=A0AAE1V2D5_9SOLA|nr:hypothetical protein RND71_035651 [Anisodus tanguticus]